MKTALITGAAGFLGRHFARRLTSDGYMLRCVDGRQDARDVFRREGGNYDLVVHCAAAGADRASIDQNPLALAANFELDAGLFSWAARTKPRRVVYLSSSAAYPVNLQAGGSSRALREADIDLRAPQEPDGIYGWCKLTGERLAVLARAAGVPVTVARPFSGFGEDQGERFPFGALAARAVRREDPFMIWGTGGQVRDFIHVSDVVAAIMVMAGEGIDGPVNLGTGRGTMMIQLAGMACEAAGYQTVTMEAHPEKPAGVAYRVADVTAMNEFYTAKVSLEEGVARAMRHLAAA